MTSLTRCILLVLGLVAGARLSSAVDNEISEKISQLEAKVYARNGPVTGVEETLSNLKQLNELLSNETDNPAAEKKRAPIQALLVASLMNLERCNVVVTSGFTSLVDYYNQQGYVNIIAYVKDCRQKHLQFCKPQYAEMLSEKVTDLGEVIEGGMADLRDDIANAVPDQKLERMHLFVPRKYLKAGIVKIVSDITGSLETAASLAKGNKEKFAEIFDETIGNLCSVIQEDLHEVMEYYQQLVLYRAADMDANEMNWYTNYQVCNNILRNLESVVDELYSEYAPKVTRTGRSAFSKFWSP